MPIRPGVGQPIVREYLYGFVAVSPFDGGCTSLILPWVDTQTLALFLRHTAHEFADRFGLMLLDGAGWHQARDLALPSNLRLLFLPPRSPELNPGAPGSSPSGSTCARTTLATTLSRPSRRSANGSAKACAPSQRSRTWSAP